MNYDANAESTNLIVDMSCSGKSGQYETYYSPNDDPIAFPHLEGNHGQFGVDRVLVLG